MTGCRRQEFSIDVSLPAEIWGNYHISYYASDGKGGLWINTTIPLEQGHFNLKGASRKSSPIYIRDDRQNEAMFFISPGDKLALTGDDANPTVWSATGNEISEQLVEYRKSGESIENFVKSNPDSPVSSLLLLTSFPRRENPAGFVELWNCLGKKAQRLEMAGIVGTPDIGANSPFLLDKEGTARLRGSAAKVTAIAFCSTNGWSDTLRTNGRPTLIYFYERSGEERYLEATDSIRRLAKAFPDSAKRNLAMFSFQSDSLSWKSQIRQDSLKKITHAWVPLGQADKRMQALGVPSSPWFIVIDGKGTQQYRGDDPAKAAASFRRLAEKKK